MGLVRHQNRYVSEEHSIREEKTYFTASELIMLRQGLYSPHRTYQLELIVLNWTKRIGKKKNFFGALSIFFCSGLYSIYKTYL